ncbi:DUF177 domain-containing protein [Leucobacter sp. OH2974_COT-288]|nr:DUF177 domain-containing protein [Leucobacter sp. OH2974_COT-288]
MSKNFTFAIRDIYNRPGEMREHELDVVLPEAWGEGLAAVRQGTTVALAVRLESVHEGILATVGADTTVHAECSRCLSEFDETLRVDFIELFAYNPTETDEYGVHGDHVNLEPPLRDAVVLALPFTPVCREECAGLDPATGERLTEAAAAPAETVDPRWAALAGFSVDEDNGTEK